MTKEEIFNYFYTNSANLGMKEIGIAMLAGVLIAAIIFIIYWITYRGVSYNARFNVSLVAILLISVVIMLMISSNIIISLGMVGALSIVRFRTAIKDSRDTMFIFWAIAEGLCVGSNNFKLALVTTVFIGIVMLVTGVFIKPGNKYLLVIRNNGQLIEEAALEQAMKPFVNNCKVRSSSLQGDEQEFIFEIKTKGEMSTSIVKALRDIEGVDSINWVSETGDMIG